MHSSQQLSLGRLNPQSFELKTEIRNLKIRKPRYQIKTKSSLKFINFELIKITKNILAKKLKRVPVPCLAAFLES